MSALKSIGARGLTTLVSFVCGMLTIRLITGSAGEAYYGLYAMLTTLSAVLPFTDLGAGGAIVNTAAVSENPRTDRKLADQLTSVDRILLCSSGIGLVLNVAMLTTGGWNWILGTAGTLPQAGLAAFVCFGVFCLQPPLGLWARIQLGLHKQHIVILLQGLVSPLTLLGVWLMVTFIGAPASSFLAVSSFLAALLIAFAGTVLTGYLVRPIVWQAMRRAWNPRRFPGVRVMDIGWPMLAQLVSYPIAVSSQRFVLAQSSTHSEQAEFSAAAQVFNALIMLISAAGVALWPMYARNRARGPLKRGPWVLSAAFAGGTLVASFMVWVIGPLLFGFVSNGAFQVHTSTIVGFAAMTLCQAVLYPLGMFIMDAPGLRFQVIPTLSMAAASIGLAIWLTPTLGVTGPLVANVIAVTICQIIPFGWYIRRHRERLLGGTAATHTNVQVGG